MKNTHAVKCYFHEIFFLNVIFLYESLGLMTLTDVFLIIVILCMIAWNVYLHLRLKKLKTQIKERKPTLELDEFLADLYNGGALLRVNRVDQTNLFMRAPRNG